MTIGIRHDDLRRRNRAMVLTAVRHADQLSRTGIAAETGLSHSTISAIAADLISEGILIEARPGDTPAPKRGRPQVAVRLNPQATSVVTASLSMNAMSASVIDYSGRVIVEERRRVETLGLSREGLVETMIAIVEKAMAAASPAPPPSRMVLSIQGITDADEKRLLWSPITPHEGIDFSDILSARFGVPVAVENDCNMIAVALRWQSPERYGRDFIAVLLSHGIGMGMVLRGELFSGTRSSAGEFGHMVHLPEGALCRCGRRGCIEAYAGNYAIWRNAHGVAQDQMIAFDVSDEDIRKLADRARSGDTLAREAFRIAGEAIGYGLGNLFSLIDAAPVAFVGTGAHAIDLMEGAIRDSIALTAGGQHVDEVKIDRFLDEEPIMRDGAALHALSAIDRTVSEGVRTSPHATPQRLYSHRMTV
ncbi:MAG: ROK family transcriptional regulator [Mesorhizobium sp.]